MFRLYHSVGWRVTASPPLGKPRERRRFTNQGRKRQGSIAARLAATTITTSNKAPVVSISDRPGAEGKVVLCRERCVAVGFHLIRRRVFTLLLYRKYVARRHLSRLPARSALQKASPFEVSTGDPRPASGEGKGASDYIVRFQKSKTSLPSPKAERLRVAGGDLCAKRRSNDRVAGVQWTPREAKQRPRREPRTAGENGSAQSALTGEV